MKKFLAALLVGLMVASAATADALPPTPKGKKYVSVTNEVVLGKEVTGYVFVQQVGTGPGVLQLAHEKLELTAGKAKAMAPSRRHTVVSLLAVPQDVAKEFKTEDALFDALKANKVKGAHRLEFPGAATVSDQIKGDSVKWTHTISAIDAKTGFTTTVAGEGADEPKVSPKRGSLPVPTVLAAGFAATVGVLLGGFWLAGRARRNV